MIVLAKELDRYFLSPLAGLAYSPISNHLEAMHEHLSGIFPTDPAVSTQL